MVRFDELFAYFSVCFFEIKFASLANVTEHQLSYFSRTAMPFDSVMSHIALLLFNGLKFAPNIVINDRIYCGFDVICTSILKKRVVRLKHCFQIVFKYAIWR